MISFGKNHLSAKCFYLFWCQRLDCCFCPNRDKSGSMYRPMWGFQNSRPSQRPFQFFFYRKFYSHYILQIIDLFLVLMCSSSTPVPLATQKYASFAITALTPVRRNISSGKLRNCEEPPVIIMP